MNRPRLLDLFCGAGGAGAGYYRAGFDVVGVDVKFQKHFPFEFHQGDALMWPLAGFEVIHCSPPCQRWTKFQTSQPQRQNMHLDLITPMRMRLREFNTPYVIENVPGAPLVDPIQICGTAFNLGVPRGQLQRHRHFESNVPLSGTRCSHKGPSVMVAGHGKDGYRGNGLNAAETRLAMGIDWMNRNEMAEAIPPAYTEFIGEQIMRLVRPA